MPPFPVTRQSLLAGAKSTDRDVRRRSLDAIARVYTEPLVEHVRRRAARDDEAARELVQAFFFRAVDKDYLADFDGEKGRFRTFIRVCVDRFVQNDARAGRRRGESAKVALDDIEERVQAEGTRPDEELERAFEDAWRRSVLELALGDLRADYEKKGRGAAFRAFELYDLASGERPTYAAIAAELGVPITTVTKQLHAVRRDLRAHAIARLAEITGGDSELEDEARILFGGD